MIIKQFSVFLMLMHDFVWTFQAALAGNGSAHSVPSENLAKKTVIVVTIFLRSKYSLCSHVMWVVIQFLSVSDARDLHK